VFENTSMLLGNNLKAFQLHIIDLNWASTPMLVPKHLLQSANFLLLTTSLVGVAVVVVVVLRKPLLCNSLCLRCLYHQRRLEYDMAQLLPSINKLLASVPAFRY
jgi:hypothetical protein